MLIAIDLAASGLIRQNRLSVDAQRRGMVTPRYCTGLAADIACRWLDCEEYRSIPTFSAADSRSYFKVARG